MIEGRRASLSALCCRADTHVGLWLDKFVAGYLGQQEAAGKDGRDPRRELLEAAAAIPEPALYRRYYKRWEMALAGRGARTAVATVGGRMVTGMGDESVLETGIRLQRTYGLPYIPGSSLKGLAASYAHAALGADWRRGSAAYQVVFGSTEEAGYVTFFDALYIPGSAPGGRPLRGDVLTVHHPDYYQAATPKPPADWDSPTPWPFLSAIGRYLLALAGPREWVAASFEIIGLALAMDGVGAKTAAGYGRLAVSLAEAQDRPAAAAAPRQLPATGAVFKGLVRGHTTAGDVLLAVPGFGNEVTGFLPQTEVGKSIYRPDNQAWVEVVGQEERDGGTVLVLKRAKK